MSVTAGARLARVMRRWADRLDDAGAPHATGWSFTFESQLGIVFHSDGRGCPLWYVGAADYERAHLNAGVVTAGKRAYRPSPRPRARGRAVVEPEG